MTQPTLFNTTETLSPRETWRREFDIKTTELDGQFWHGYSPVSFDTKEECEDDFAEKAGIPSFDEWRKGQA